MATKYPPAVPMPFGNTGQLFGYFGHHEGMIPGMCALSAWVLDSDGVRYWWNDARYPAMRYEIGEDGASTASEIVRADW